jgi:hypothetical protein
MSKWLYIQIFQLIFCLLPLAPFYNSIDWNLLPKYNACSDENWNFILHTCQAVTNVASIDRLWLLDLVESISSQFIDWHFDAAQFILLLFLCYHCLCFSLIDFRVGKVVDLWKFIIQQLKDYWSTLKFSSYFHSNLSWMSLTAFDAFVFSCDVNQISKSTA